MKTYRVVEKNTGNTYFIGADDMLGLAVKMNERKLIEFVHEIFETGDDARWDVTPLIPEND